MSTNVYNEDKRKPSTFVRVENLKVDGDIDVTGANQEGFNFQPVSTGVEGFIYDNSVNVVRKDIEILDLQNIGVLAPDDSFLRHNNGTVEFATLSPNIIIGGDDGQLLRVVAGDLEFVDEVLNSNLPSDVVFGSVTSGTLSGELSESDITPGINGQVLSTVGGVSSWVDNNDVLPSGVLNNVLVHDGTSYVSEAEFDPSNIPDLSISTGKIEDDAITPAKIQEGTDGQVLTTNGAVVEWADPSGLPSGVLGNVLVHDGTSYVSEAQINAGNIPNLSISTGKIVNGSVTLAKMANDSVGTAQLVNESVDEQRLDSNAVSTIKVQDNAITPAKIEEGADGQVLTTNGSVVEWADPAAASGNQISFIKAPLATISANENIDFDSTFEFNQIGLTKGATADIIDGFPAGVYRIEVTGSARDLSNQNASIRIENDGVDLTTSEVENLDDLNECTFTFYANSLVEDPGEITIFVSRSGSIVFSNVNLTITRY